MLKVRQDAANILFVDRVADEFIYIGDTIDDATAATAAGCTSIIVGGDWGDMRIEDITRETEGIIAVVRNLSVGNKRDDGSHDEYEITTARVQLERLNVAKVKDAAKPGFGKEVTVDIEQRRYYRMS